MTQSPAAMKAATRESLRFPLCLGLALALLGLFLASLHLIP